MDYRQRKFIIQRIKKYYKVLKIVNSDYFISIASTIMIFLMIAYQIKHGSTAYIEVFFFLAAVSIIFMMTNISKKSVLEIKIYHLKEQLNLNKHKK